MDALKQGKMQSMYGLFVLYWDPLPAITYSHEVLGERPLCALPEGYEVRTHWNVGYNTYCDNVSILRPEDRRYDLSGYILCA